MPKFVILWTDYIVYALLICGALYGWYITRQPTLQATWRKVFREPVSMCAAIVLGLCLLVAVLDSVHFRRLLPASGSAAQNAAAYSTRTESVFDIFLARQFEMREKEWSSPLSYHGWRKESNAFSAKADADYPRLKFGGGHLSDPPSQRAGDLIAKGLMGLLMGLLFAACIAWIMTSEHAYRAHKSLSQAWQDIRGSNTEYPLRAALITILVLCAIGGVIIAWKNFYHVFGTDQTGNDVLYQAMKSIRTAFVIGTLSTLATLPFAVVLGILAGYYKGWVDDVIQYLYTTLTAVPNVLLIAACVLMVQVFIDKNPQLFDTGIERADLKLFLLCVVLGLTGWASLCRLLRAETMKLRELEYVQAATAFGVSKWKIMAQHIFPNVVHLILITVVLDFSALILYEAVLSYVGVGVDPSMNSFGGMINLARSEMSRDPVVWWSFTSAFVFMVGLVLAANLFSDGVRDAFDPRSRSFRLKLFKTNNAQTAVKAGA